MSPARRRSVLLATAILAAAFESRCGARTTLPLPEPCVEAGSERRCSDTCGAGQQVCRFGYWQPCDVPVATRSCSNTCGAGTERCVDDAWQACAVPVATRPCSSVCGQGTERCTDDAWGACDAPLPAPPTLTATVRNIHLGQPDFWQTCCMGGVDPGIVATTLGSDGTPVYAGNPVTGTLTTHGQADFQSWYHDVSGVDLSTTVTLPLMPDADQAGIDTFDNEAFFPIDGQLFGDQGNVHNEDFTLETHAQILYTGGETYDFDSDDDLWVFVNGHLVVDLGGVHPSLFGSVALDQVAGQIGIVTGQTYPLDVFYANRQPPGAVLVISIPESDLWSCP
jgi:fibro-slime domain-containing protein